MKLSSIIYRLSATLALTACAQGNHAALGDLRALEVSNCIDHRVDLSDPEIRSASEIMVAGASDTGREVWSSMERRSRSFSSRQAASKRRILDIVGNRLNGYDVCFSNRCDDAPRHGPMLVFGCEFQNCRAKGAVLVEADGRAIAFAAAELDDTGKEERVGTAAIAGASRGGKHLAIYVADHNYPRNRIRSLLSAWFVLERDFVSRTAAGNEPDRQLLARPFQEKSHIASARECLLS